MKLVFSITLLLLTTSVFGHPGVPASFYDYEPEHENLFPKEMVCTIERHASMDIELGLTYEENMELREPVIKHIFKYQGEGLYKRLYGAHPIFGKPEPYLDETIFRAKISDDTPLMLLFQVPKYEGNRGVDWVFQLDKRSSSNGIRQEYRDGRFTERYATMWDTGTCKYNQR